MAEKRKRQDNRRETGNGYPNGPYVQGQPGGQSPYGEQGGYQQGPYSQGQPGGRKPYGEQGGYQQGPYSQGQPGRQNPYGEPGEYQQEAYGRQGQPMGRNPYGRQGEYQQGPYRQNPQEGRGQNPQGAYGPRGAQQGGPNPYGPQGGYYAQGRQQGYQQPPYYQGGKPPKKKKKARRRVMFVLEVLVLVILAGGLFVFSRLNKMQRVNIKPGEIIVNEQIPEQEKEVMETYTNIALYGVDSREGNLETDAHSDALLIASINNKTKDVKLVSVYRDTYLDNTNGEYRKATECYFFGGPKRSMSMLNTNLDLDIQDFVTVDFNALADIVDAIGGLEIDVQEEEITWINGYQTEGSQVTGKEIVPVTYAGPQVLNGLQTLSYCRIRYTSGDDYKRTERQRDVLNKILQKAKTLPVTNLVGLVDEMFGHIATSLSLPELIDLAKDIASYNLVATTGFPDDLTTGKTPTGSDCVIPRNLANNVQRLHQWLFGDNGYTPSETVQSISDTIINVTGVQ